MTAARWSPGRIFWTALAAALLVIGGAPIFVLLAAALFRIAS